MPVNANPIRAIGKNRFVLAGSFLPNGSSALAAAGILGAGFTVVRTSAGLFTVTLAEKWLRLLTAKLTLQTAAVSQAQLQLGTTDVSGAKTVEIRSVAPTGAGDTTLIVADIASNANNRIHFELTLSQDTVQT